MDIQTSESEISRSLQILPEPVRSRSVQNLSNPEISSFCQKKSQLDSQTFESEIVPYPVISRSVRNLPDSLHLRSIKNSSESELPQTLKEVSKSIPILDNSRNLQIHPKLQNAEPVFSSSLQIQPDQKIHQEVERVLQSEISIQENLARTSEFDPAQSPILEQSSPEHSRMWEFGGQSRERKVQSLKRVHSNSESSRLHPKRELVRQSDHAGSRMQDLARPSEPVPTPVHSSSEDSRVCPVEDLIQKYSKPKSVWSEAVRSSTELARNSQELFRKPSDPVSSDPVHFNSEPVKSSSRISSVEDSARSSSSDPVHYNSEPVNSSSRNSRMSLVEDDSRMSSMSAKSNPEPVLSKSRNSRISQVEDSARISSLSELPDSGVSREVAPDLIPTQEQDPGFEDQVKTKIKFIAKELE